MAEVNIWAPKAHQIELQAQGRFLPLQPTAPGWWSLSDSSITHGTHYSFRINGEGLFPDPRSFSQPKGVHGPSCWIDHSLFHWTDTHWKQPSLRSAIFYELHVGTFTPQGTFDAVIHHLDHLVRLGITHIELMPVAEFSGKRGWGYDGVSLYASHHAYGGPEGLKRLVNACHSRGLSVLLDVVYNHLGPVGNYLNLYGYYFTDKYSTPWGQAVNLDGPDSKEVRQFFIDNALMWLREYHFDGLRLDAIHAIIDTSKMHFLEQISMEVKNLQKKLNRPLILIAESDLNDSQIIKPREQGGYGIDAQWNEDFHHALHALMTEERERYYEDFGEVADLAKVLTKGLVYDGCYSVHRKRNHGRPADNTSPHQYVAYAQNHDQVGNRALGERTSQLLSSDQIKLAAALVFTSPFLPMLFQGEEWGSKAPFLYFTDHEEPSLGKAVYEGRKKEFSDFERIADKIPHPQSEDTFKQSQLRWGELGQPPHDALLEWYQRLIKLRREQKDLNDPNWKNIHVNFDENKRWLCMKRGLLLMAFNFAPEAQDLPIENVSGKKMLLASKEGVEVKHYSIQLPSYGFAMLNLGADEGNLG